MVAWAVVSSLFSAMLLMDQGMLIWLPFAFALPAAVLHVGAAVVVWSGLKGFKDEIRQAYKFICVGLIFVGFTQLQLPVISLFGLWELRENGLIIIPFVLPFIFFSMGIRRFAKLLNITSSWASPWLVNGAGLVFGGLMAIVPHAPNNTSPLAFAGTMMLLGWIAVQALALIVMVLQIKGTIGASYVNAMAWLFVTYVSVLVTDVMYLVTLLVTSPGTWYLDYNISVAPFVAVGLLWLRSGYAFNAVTAPEPAPNHLGQFFGPTTAIAAGTPPSIEVVMYVQAMASNPRDLDITLDKLRIITAKYEPGKPLTATEQAQLAEVYLGIESYLINKDPLRKFDRTHIRQDVENTFAKQVLAQTFWPGLGVKTI